MKTNSLAATAALALALMPATFANASMHVGPKPRQRSMPVFIEDEPKKPSPADAMMERARLRRLGATS